MGADVFHSGLGYRKSRISKRSEGECDRRRDSGAEGDRGELIENCAVALVVFCLSMLFGSAFFTY